jgi:hypothetical protein
VPAENVSGAMNGGASMATQAADKSISAASAVTTSSAVSASVSTSDLKKQNESLRVSKELSEQKVVKSVTCKRMLTSCCVSSAGTTS